MGTDELKEFVVIFGNQTCRASKHVALRIIDQVCQVIQEILKKNQYPF